jgi:hypothetical protein
MQHRWRAAIAALSMSAVVAGLAWPLPTARVFAQTVAVQTLPKSLELHGTLGTQTIQMHLEVKPEEEDGWRGYYVVAGKKILLAGEADGQSLSLEESENGIDVSGQWEGKWEGKLLRGTWSSEDGQRSLAFVLEQSATRQTVAAGAPAAALRK